MSSDYTLMTLYNVSITFTTQSTPNDGAIVNQTCAQMNANGNGTATTTENGVANARGLLRYNFLEQQLSFMQNIAVTNFVSNGTASSDPTTITFTVEVEKGDAVLITADELNSGAILTGTAALTRFIARALIESRTSIETAVYSPVSTTPPSGQGDGVATDRNSFLIESIQVGPIATSLSAATSLITVTKIF